MLICCPRPVRLPRHVHLRPLRPLLLMPLLPLHLPLLLPQNIVQTYTYVVKPLAGDLAMQVRCARVQSARCYCSLACSQRLLKVLRALSLCRLAAAAAVTMTPLLPPPGCRRHVCRRPSPTR